MPYKFGKEAVSSFYIMNLQAKVHGIVITSTSPIDIIILDYLFSVVFQKQQRVYTWNFQECFSKLPRVE